MTVGLLLAATLVSCDSKSKADDGQRFDKALSRVDSLLVVGDTAQATELNRMIWETASDDLHRITAKVREAEIAVAKGDLKQGEIALKECNAYYDTTRQSNKENRMLRMATAILNSALKENEGDHAKALDQKKVAASQAYELNARHTYVRLSKEIFDKYWQNGNYSSAIDGYKRILTYSVNNNMHKETRISLFSLQNAFLSLGDTQKSQRYLDEITLLGDTAATERCKQEIAQALIYINDMNVEKLGGCIDNLEALVADKNLHDKYGETYLSMKAELFLQRKDYGKAQEILGELDANKSPRGRQYYHNEYGQLLNAQLLLSIGKTDSAKHILDQISPYKLKNKSLPLYKRYMDVLTDYHSAIGDEKEAYLYAKKKCALIDTLNFDSFRHDMAYQNLAIKRDTTIISQKIKMEKQRNVIERLSFWRSFWTVVIVVVVLAVLMTYYNISLKRMRKRELELAQESEALASEVRQRRMELQEQKEKLEEKNQDMRKELEYSHHIQQNILPDESLLRTKGIEDNFIIYRPCNQVSGDFYWFKHIQDRMYVCVGDATGHGVPGAFIAMVASTLLNDIASNGDQSSPKYIVDQLDEKLGQVLRNNDLIQNKDSVDLSMFCLDTDAHSTKLCLARHIAYIIRKDGTFETVNGTKRSICDYDRTFTEKEFEEFDIDLQDGDRIYMTSDGYESQMGGSQNKKLRRNRMASFFSDIADKPMSVQKIELERRLEEWQGSNEQTDDILIIGLKIGRT